MCFMVVSGKPRRARHAENRHGGQPQALLSVLPAQQVARHVCLLGRSLWAQPDLCADWKLRLVGDSGRSRLTRQGGQAEPGRACLPYQVLSWASGRHQPVWAPPASRRVWWPRQVSCVLAGWAGDSAAGRPEERLTPTPGGTPLPAAPVSALPVAGPQSRGCGAEGSSPEQRPSCQQPWPRGAAVLARSDIHVTGIPFLFLQTPPLGLKTICYLSAQINLCR